MAHLPARRKAIETAILFGAIPCLLGVGIGQYLRLTGTVWLSNAGAFWPSVCLGISLAVLVSLATGSSHPNGTRLRLDHAHVDVAVLPALVHGTRDPNLRPS